MTVAEAENGYIVPRRFSYTARPCVAVDDAPDASLGIDDIDIRLR